MNRCLPTLTLLGSFLSPVLAQQPGDLDPSFGTGGIVTTDFRNAIDRAFDFVLQPDGKMVAAGTSYATVIGPNQSFLIARIKQDGTLDSTFSDDGLASTVVGFGYSEARAVALQPDGKIVAAGISLGLSYGDLTVVRYNTDGTLDNTFDTNGIATLELGFVEEAWDVALQPDGKIVVAGTFRAPTLGIEDMLVVRLLSNGIIDSTFGNNGVVFTDYTADQGYDVELLPDGRILVAGGAIAGFNGKVLLARYLTDGTPDSSFNGTGMLVSNLGTMATARTMGIQADGKIAIAGSVYAGGTFNFLVARYHSDGILDSTFSGDGFVATDISTHYDASMDLAIDSSWQIVIAGTTGTGNDYDFALLRYSSTGVLDGAFGTAGKVLTSFGPKTDWAYGVELQPDGRILAAGSALILQQDDVALARYNTDGSLDTTFSDDGLVTIGLNSFDGAYAVGIRPNGRILSGGTSDGNFALAQYTRKGKPDSTFSSDGLVTNDFDGGIDIIHDIALSIDDKATLSGVANIGTASSFALARYNVFGFLDNSFSGDGKLTTTIGTVSAARAVAIQPNGRILAAGVSFTNKNDFAAARYHTTGLMDNSFDFDGKVVTAVTSENNEAQGLVLQPDGKIILAGVALSSFALVRYHANGSLDNTFGSGGKVITPVGTGDTAYAAALLADGRILVAGVSDGKFALVRYLADGSLDTTLSGDGMLKTSIGTYAEARAMSVMPDGRIVLAGTSDGRFAVARYEPDGDLDTGFSVDGIVTVMIGSRAHGRALALQSDGKIVVAGEAMGDFALIRLLGFPCTPTADTLALSGCSPFTSPSGHHTWTVSGTYLDTVYNEAGCDSFLTINLTILLPDTSVSVSGYVMTANAAGATYQWINCANGWWVPAATQQSFTVTNAGSYAVMVTQQGCKDTSNCRFFCNSFSTVSVTACNSYTSPGGSSTWTTSGTYHDTISNGFGCDSFMTIYLAIVAPPDTTVTVSGTHTLNALATGVSYQWFDCSTGTPIIGATSSTFTPSDSGSYAVVVTNNGCSDTSSCRTVVPPCFSAGNVTANECFSYVSPSGHYTWTTSGLYYDTLPNAAGCDSIITVYLTIRGPDTSVVVIGDSLIAVEPGALYQWIDCSKLQPIAGANQQTFVPAQTGSYAVIVTKNGCRDTSDCRYVQLVGVDKRGMEKLQVFPNPTDGRFSVTGMGLTGATIELRDLAGRMVQTVSCERDQETIWITGPAGIYVLTIRTQDETVARAKVVRL